MALATFNPLQVAKIRFGNSSVDQVGIVQLIRYQSKLPIEMSTSNTDGSKSTLPSWAWRTYVGSELQSRSPAVEKARFPLVLLQYGMKRVGVRRPSFYAGDLEH